MAATAAPARTARPAPRRRARRSQPRKPPARTTQPRSTRARGRTPARGIAVPAQLIPAAVGRTAGAVGGLADSGLMVRMTRSRTWIGVLGALLVGIVALNVASLSLTASSGKVAARGDSLARENAVLRSRLVDGLSGERVEAVAAGLGLAVPTPQQIEYLDAASRDAAVAAKRIEQGSVAGPSTGVAPAPSVSAPPPVIPPAEAGLPVATAPEVPPPAPPAP